VFEKIALIGIGLIGASVSHGIRRAHLAKSIAVSTRREATLAAAKRLGLGDNYAIDPADAVRGADLVLISAPVMAYEAIMHQISSSLEAGAILSDVGSVKRHAHNMLGKNLPDNVHLVPGHPIAGTEQSGPSAGFAELFDNRWCVLTPHENVDRGAVDKMTAFWRALGSNVELMDADHHDRVLAITSHLPHLIAYNIVGTVADLETDTQSEVVKFSASGFRDFTRIAASDPVMWRDVFLTNRVAVLEMMDRFLADLTKLQAAVKSGDGVALEAMFKRTRDIRRSIIDAGQETAEADFGRPHGKDM